MTKRRDTTLKVYPRTYRLSEDVGALKTWFCCREPPIIEVPDEPWVDELFKARRPPTEEELMSLYRKLWAFHLPWRYDLTDAPLKELPPDFPLDQLREVIWWQLLQARGPWTRERIKRARWGVVSYIRRDGMKREAAYDHAAMLLQGTPAECGRDMMKKDYDAVEREIPF